MNRILLIPLLFGLFTLAGCAPPAEGDPPVATVSQRMSLAQALEGLGEVVDRAEAAQLADIAFDHSRALARLYDITDSPFVQNQKVNRGENARGLCYHWAEDLEARLLQEGFRTLKVRRAISPVRLLNPFEHSTVAITTPGATLENGLILDPWRYGAPCSGLRLPRIPATTGSRA